MKNVQILIITAFTSALALFANEALAEEPKAENNVTSDVRTIISENDNSRTIIVGVNKDKTESGLSTQSVIVAPDYNCYAPYKKPQPLHHQHDNRHHLPAHE